MRRGRLQRAGEAWEALLRAQSQLMGRFERSGDFEPLNSREYDVLFNLAAAGGSLPMKDLVARALLTQPSMSRMVERMENAGLVERQPNPEDRRALNVVLTAAGTRAQRTIGRRHLRSIARELDELSDAELEQLTALCAKLRKKVSG